MEDLSAAMSFAADIPGDLLEELLTRLSIKSLVRFSSTCKSFRSLIRNPNFVAKHAHRAQIVSTGSNDFSFVVTDRSLKLELYSVSDSARRYDRIDLNTALSLNSAVGPYKQIEVIGCCRGLICLVYRLFNDFRTTCIWNPAIRQIKVIAVDTVRYSNELCGFGYHNRMNDYTYVRFPQVVFGFLQLKVYSVSSGTWKFSEKFLREEIDRPILREEIDRPICVPPMVCINGFCYWMECDFVGEGEQPQFPILMAYDVVMGTLKDIKLPLLNFFDNRTFLMDFVIITELNEKLCVVDYRNANMIELWVMDDENGRVSWTKLFSQTIVYAVIPSFLFTRSGQVVWHERSSNMIMRKPGSKQEIKLPFKLPPNLQRIFLYEETLQSVYETTLIDKQLMISGIDRC